jgi:hypothetical protein
MDSFIIIEFYLVHNIFDDLSSLNMFNKVYNMVLHNQK